MTRPDVSMDASSLTPGALKNVPSEKDPGDGTSGDFVRYDHTHDQSNEVKVAQCLLTNTNMAVGSVPSIAASRFII